MKSMYEIAKTNCYPNKQYKIVVNNGDMGSENCVCFFKKTFDKITKI